MSPTRVPLVRVALLHTPIVHAADLKTMPKDNSGKGNTRDAPKWLADGESINLVIPDITQRVPDTTGNAAVDLENIPTKEVTM